MEALEQSLRDINGGRDINEIISEVDGENASPTIFYNFDKHIQQNYNHKPVFKLIDCVVCSEMYVCVPGLENSCCP